MDAMSVKAMRTLKDNRRILTRKQLQTLRGQVFAGDADGAMRGLHKIINRRRRDRKEGEA